MKHRHTHPRGFLGAALSAVILCFAPVVILSCGSSEKSQEELTDLSTVPASFTISRVSDGRQNPPVTKVTASAAFKGEGLTFIELKNGKVELIDRDGRIVELPVRTNQFGAPYYTVELDTVLTLGQAYRFRVTLANGDVIENRVTTPSNDLEITSPTPYSTISKAQPLAVTWTGTNTGKNASIFIAPETPDIFSILGTAISPADDDGATTLTPEALAKLTPGSDYVLTVARGNIEPANGFKSGSWLGAFLISSIPVSVTE
jgi:hypothetical protein